MARRLEITVLLAALTTASAAARTHSVYSANNLNKLLSGQAVNGYRLADGDTIAIAANIEIGANATISKRVTIKSSGDTARTISRTSSYAWVVFNVTGQVTLEKITFDGKSANGGRMFNVSGSGSLTLGNGATVKNFLCGYGTAQAPILVSSSSASFTLGEGSLVSNCRNASEHGGAIYNLGAVMIAGGRITGCSTTTDGTHSGGAIYSSGAVTVSGGQIVSCTATGGGGAIYNDGGTVAMTGGLITGCSGARGGGVDNANGTFVVTGGAFTNCTASSANGGGAIYNAGTFVFTGGTVYGGKATQGPGGALCNAGAAEVAGGEMTGCSASNYGGAIYTTGSLDVSGSPQIASNTVKGVVNNVRPDGDGRIRLAGNFAGSVGVTYPASVADGQIFGVYVSGSGALNFFYDTAPSFKGQISGARLVWKDAASVRYPDGNKTFATALAEAASGGGMIELTADFAEDLAVPAGYIVTIDLMGRKVTGGITAAGRVTVTDSSPLKGGEVTGALLPAAAGAFTLDYGTYAAEPPDAWLADGRVVLANADGTHSVTTVVRDDAVSSMALDVREGAVRVVNDPAADILPITYASGRWVYGASENGARRTQVYAVAAGTDSPVAAWRAGKDIAEGKASGDGTYDYAPDAEIAEIGARQLLNDAPCEAEFNWRQNCWGLVKTVHSNDNGQLTAYFKFPDPAFGVTQRSDVTNAYEIIINDAMLESLGFSRIGGMSPASVENHCNVMQPNGLRIWENLVTGANPTNDYVGTVGAYDQSSPDTLTIAMAPSSPDPRYGYLVFYDLRRATNGWTRIAGPKEDPSFRVNLHAGDMTGERNPTGLYRIYTLIIPESNPAITNEIPATNIIGVLRVDSPCTNTITAIPWRRLASAPDQAKDVTVAEVVVENNLLPGDRLYAYDNDSGLFYGWTMTRRRGGSVDWEAMLSTTADGVTTADATLTTLPRGGAFWTVRADPETAPGPRPYFVCGQHQSGAYTNVIAGGSDDEPRSTILANPTPSPVAINDMVFEGEIGQTDTIAVPTVSPDVPRIYYRNPANTQWGYSSKSISHGRIRSVWTPAGTVVPGVGFWYIRRREGELKIVWEGWSENR
ncbi:MAG: hypothetical protein J6T01_06175 [Kiritimatiellae bacterium]|nr:hypothetical protein [Kiritimatiellia bacterium]